MLRVDQLIPACAGFKLSRVGAAIACAYGLADVGGLYRVR